MYKSVLVSVTGPVADTGQCTAHARPPTHIILILIPSAAGRITSRSVRRHYPPTYLSWHLSPSFIIYTVSPWRTSNANSQYVLGNANHVGHLLWHEPAHPQFMGSLHWLWVTWVLVRRQSLVSCSPCTIRGSTLCRIAVLVARRALAASTIHCGPRPKGSSRTTDPELAAPPIVS